MKSKYCDKNIHWADFSADKTLKKFPNEEVYNVASGITPSGFIHVGNFREVITTEIVRRSLEDKGYKTKFYYSWDSYDRFRKVPSDIPKEFEKYIGTPVGEIPSPFSNDKIETYADYFIKEFEKEVKDFGLKNIEFQKQHLIQTSGIYSESIKKILQNKDKIIEILNKYRSDDTKLNSSYWPIEVFDRDTKKDTNKIISYDNNYTLNYIDENKKEKSINFKDEPKVKLKWKSDWPMRWNYFKIAFEPGGRDHSTPGSSYSVGSDIILEIFNRKSPEYTMYDFVKIKGQGSKISSSEGGALRIRDLNMVYTNEIIMFIFVSSRPKKELEISFDLDVIKIYEDFDKLERIYYDIETEKNEKTLINLKRSYELSQSIDENGNRDVQKKIPIQISVRHLSVLIQANDFDREKVKKYYEKDFKNSFDEKRFNQRFDCMKNWIEKYAPDDFKFQIKNEISNTNQEEKKVLDYLIETLENSNDEKTLIENFKKSSEILNTDMKTFFSISYNLIIGKEKGPKLSSFLFENKEKILNLLKLHN